MAQTLSFGFDGDDGLGDRLLAAVLRGEKTATSSLAVEYLSGDPLPRVGERLTLVDHSGGVHGKVETTRVTITPRHLVGDDVAHDEGEGFADAADWRQDHVCYWAEVTDLVRSEAGDPGWELREAEPVVVHWFRLLDSGGAAPRTHESRVATGGLHVAGRGDTMGVCRYQPRPTTRCGPCWRWLPTSRARW